MDMRCCLQGSTFEYSRQESTAMTPCAQRHRPHDPTEHDHIHGDGCGHRAVSHDDHLDYIHDGHWHAPHDGHYDRTPQSGPLTISQTQRARPPHGPSGIGHVYAESPVQ
jgi:hypothetical protein